MIFQELENSNSSRHGWGGSRENLPVYHPSANKPLEIFRGPYPTLIVFELKLLPYDDYEGTYIGIAHVGSLQVMFGENWNDKPTCFTLPNQLHHA